MKTLILNEYRYTVGKKGYLSMYSQETGEMLLRQDAREIPDAIVSMGTKGYRMIEGEELEEVMDWIEEEMKGKR